MRNYEKVEVQLKTDFPEVTNVDLTANQRFDNSSELEMEILTSFPAGDRNDLTKKVKFIKGSEFTQIPEINTVSEKSLIMEIDEHFYENFEKVVSNTELMDKTVIPFVQDLYTDTNEIEKADQLHHSDEEPMIITIKQTYEIANVAKLLNTTDFANTTTEESFDLTNVGCDFTSALTNEVLCNITESETYKLFKHDGQTQEIAEYCERSAVNIIDISATPVHDQCNTDAAQLKSNIKQKIQSSEQLHERNILQDISNTTNQKSDESVKKFLSLPKDLENQNGKRKKFKVKVPSVVSGAEWQRIMQTKENEKIAKAEEAELRKKIKLEKQEELKIKKKADRVKKEEQKFKKELLRFEKEKEKLLKQQKRMKDLEEKKKAAENFLLKKKEEAQIKETIASLQKRQEELTSN